MVETVLERTTTATSYPQQVLHWIQGQTVPSQSGETFPRYNPATGEVLGHVARGSKAEAERAIQAATESFSAWSLTNPITRANVLRKATQIMEARKEEIASIVALEGGKAMKDALGEVGAAIEMGYFVAGEGRRFYGRTTTSGVQDRTAMTIRQPIGVCALIIASNTPIANVAWKAYPALMGGNTAIMKASEDTPYSALWFAQVLKEAGLPDGVFSVLQGYGQEVGAPLVEDHRVDLVSFTGSVPVGRWIQKTAGERLAKVCLELGGKNALTVCDDADLELAATCAALSAFSNAGQRCAAGSRILVFESVYDEFKRIFVEKAKNLKVGVSDQDDLGPVINEKQLNNMLAGVQRAVEKDGATVLVGGKRLDEAAHKGGFYMAPTILENVAHSAEITCAELFGPITVLYKVKDFDEAVRLTNDSPMGLTSAIHTKSIHRAQRFIELSRHGVVSVNGNTHGSEPHMPFGGLRESGNGFREAGTEALDVYTDWKTVYVKYDPSQV